MKTYKELMNQLNEGRFAVTGSSILFASKINNLADKIRNEKDPDKKLEYLALQNKFLGFMMGLNFTLMQKKEKGRGSSVFRRRRMK